ncbi:MAG: family 20 glycosylhydrolase [Victivallaceae bacterium]
MKTLPDIRKFEPSQNTEHRYFVPMHTKTGMIAGSFSAETLLAIEEDFTLFTGRSTEWEIVNRDVGFYACLGICDDTTGNAVFDSLPADRQDAYVLRINPDHVELAASTGAGFFYGWQTLCQLAEDASIECGTIIDWAALELRCLHVDLKGMTPKFEYLLELIKKISRLKINSIMLEYEDKIRYESHPVIAHPAMAYSKEQIKVLLNLCHSRFIRVIPKLQCYGHWDYILKHREYYDLREGGGASSYQICPSVERSFTVWQDMVDELLELHRDDEYFHIGADEVDMNIPCSNCDGHDRFQMYIRHVERAADYLRGQGKKVLIWDDVFRNHKLDECNDLLKKTELCVWQYNDVNEEFISRFKDCGTRALAASAVRVTHLARPDVDNQALRVMNLNRWAEVINDYQLDGHICTAWTRAQCQTPSEGFIPSLFYLIAIFAESAWQGAPVEMAGFNRRFAKGAFGADLPMLADAAACIDAAPEKAGKIFASSMNLVRRNRDIVEIMELMAELEKVKEYIDYCFKADMALYPAYLNGTVTDKIKNNYLDGVRITRQKIAAVTEKIHAVLGKYMPEPMIKEIIETRFTYVQILNDQMEKIITPAGIV